MIETSSYKYFYRVFPTFLLYNPENLLIKFELDSIIRYKIMNIYLR